MEIYDVSADWESWEIRTIEFSNGADFKFTTQTMYKENRRRYIKRLTRLQEDTEELVAESYINEIDLIGHEFGNFNPGDYINRELFKLGYLEKADFRNYESKENQ